MIVFGKCHLEKETFQIKYLFFAIYGVEVNGVGIVVHVELV